MVACVWCPSCNRRTQGLFHSVGVLCVRVCIHIFVCIVRIRVRTDRASHPTEKCVNVNKQFNYINESCGRCGGGVCGRDVVFVMVPEQKLEATTGRNTTGKFGAASDRPTAPNGTEIDSERHRKNWARSCTYIVIRWWWPQQSANRLYGCIEIALCLRVCLWLGVCLSVA